MHALHLRATAIIMLLVHILMMTFVYIYEANCVHEYILLHALKFYCLRIMGTVNGVGTIANINALFVTLVGHATC